MRGHGDPLGARIDLMQRETNLSGLIEGLGYEVVRVETAPAGLDVPVGDPVIHDRLAGTGIAASDVVLAVGVDRGVRNCSTYSSRLVGLAPQP